MSKRKPAFEPDLEKAADLTLALMSLGLHNEYRHPDGQTTARAWKGYDWEVLDLLHKRGDIADPVGKAKSVIVTPEGLARSQALAREHLPPDA